MITIRNADALEGKVRIVFSPFFETCQALAVLEHPEPHPGQEAWVARCRQDLAAKELETFTSIGNTLGSYRMMDEVFDLPSEMYDASGYGESLAGFLGRSPWARHHLVLDTKTYDRIGRFLVTFWEKAMDPYIGSRKDSILDAIRLDTNLLKERGEAAYLCSLSPRIRKKGRGATDLVIEKKLELNLDASRLKELRIYASHFSAPFLIVAGDFSGKRIKFLALCRELERADTPRECTPEGVSTLAFALSDTTRLRMLMMARTPVSQKALGEMMGLAKSTVSRHVSILVESGAMERVDLGEPKLVANRNGIGRLSSNALSLLGINEGS